MTSLTWNQITDSLSPSLYIPEGIEKMSTLEAAKAYARTGFYVLPVNPKSKNPGSMLGAGWPDLSTRDIKKIESYFLNQETALAIHVGKSGAIVFDVDDPNKLPQILSRELFNSSVPMQSTRMDGDKRRGHYIFKVDDGSRYGNSLGKLNGDWGDVRGCNGVIIVSPSDHVHEYGYYKWQRTGALPKLPECLDLLLPKRIGGGFTSVTTQEAQAFIDKYVGNSYPDLLLAKVNYLIENPPARNTRHTRFLNFLLARLTDVSVGFYPAHVALTETQKLFNQFKSKDEQSPNEFKDMVHWAIACIESMTVEEKALHAYQNAPHLDEEIMKWVRSNGN